MLAGAATQASPALADSTFAAPAYASAACTPTAQGHPLGIGPGQWNSPVGLPLTPDGTPLPQRIVIGEFDSTADQTAVNGLLAQCGLPAVALSTDTNPWYGPTASPGLEATLDAAVVAAALPPRAEIVMTNSSANAGWYGMLVTAVDACGYEFSSTPATGPSTYTVSKGASFPSGGCIISFSYNGAETANAGTQDVQWTDALMERLAELGTIVAVAAGDEGSGACIPMQGTPYFADPVLVSVTSVSVTSNVMTLTTATDHGFTAGQQVFLAAIAPDIDRLYTIQSTPTARTFTVPLVHANLASTAVTSYASVDFGGLVPAYLAVHPDALSVGGTQWTSQPESMAHGTSIDYVAGSTVQNYVWKDSNANPNCANLSTFPNSGGEGTGGGQSTVYAMPDYQRVQAQASYPVLPAKRMTPDLAALAGWPAYAIGNPGISVAGAGIASGVATLYFNAPPGMSTGESVAVADLAAPFAALNGTQVITATGENSISFATSAGTTSAQYVSDGTATQTCPGNTYPCAAGDFPWYPVLGTSAATPLVAVGIANVNAVLSARGLPVVDNAGGSMDVHSIVYGDDFRSAFTDVVDGNNDIHGLGGWDARTGYDMATGMGVPNFRTLTSLLISKLTPAAPSGGGTPAAAVPAVPAVPVEAPAEAVVAEPAPQPAAPAPVLTSPGPGVLMSTGPAASAAPRARFGGMASSSRDAAPSAFLRPNRWTVPVLRVPASTGPVSVWLKVDGSWASIGLIGPTAASRVTLPSMRMSRRGVYPLRLITASGSRLFATIEVR